MLATVELTLMQVAILLMVNLTQLDSRKKFLTVNINKICWNIFIKNCNKRNKCYIKNQLKMCQPLIFIMELKLKVGRHQNTEWMSKRAQEKHRRDCGEFEESFFLCFIIILSSFSYRCVHNLESRVIGDRHWWCALNREPKSSTSVSFCCVLLWNRRIFFALKLKIIYHKMKFLIQLIVVAYFVSAAVARSVGNRNDESPCKFAKLFSHK